MIIPPDVDGDTGKKVLEEQLVPVQRPPATGRGAESDHPPPYESVQPVLPQPCNFISIKRVNEAVKDTFVIDPSITLPPALLTPLDDGTQERDRKNIHLQSVNGSVDVSVVFVTNDDTKPGPSTKRSTIHAQSRNGSVTVKLSAPSVRPGIEMTATSKNGSVALYLPRSFNGFLTLSSVNGAIIFSDAVLQNLTTFSHVGATKRCFLGDFVGATLPEGGEWSGDELVASSTNGKIKLFYVDEAKPSSNSSNSSCVIQ